MSLPVNNFSYSSESDDDDAPGEIRSSDARSTQLSQVRNDRQRDKEAKERVREKRRNRNEMFTAQKKQKLESFGERALPEDILEAVSAKHNKLAEEIEKDSDDSNDDEEPSGDESEGGSDSDDSGDDSDDDFIALDSTTKNDALKVVTVQDTKKNTSSIENALAFRNSRLYSGPNAPNRCSADKRRGLAQKKRVMRMT